MKIEHALCGAIIFSFFCHTLSFYSCLIIVLYYFSDSLIITLSNCTTSFVAGFAVFSVLGFLAYSLKSSVGNVVSSGIC